MMVVSERGAGFTFVRIKRIFDSLQIEAYDLLRSYAGRTSLVGERNRWGFWPTNAQPRSAVLRGLEGGIPLETRAVGS